MCFFDFSGLVDESGLGRLLVRSGDSLAGLFPFPPCRSGDRLLRLTRFGLPAFLELVLDESRMRDFFLDPLGLEDLFLFELTFFLLFLFFFRFLSSSEESDEESDELLEDDDDDDDEEEEEEEDAVVLAFFFLALLDAKCSRKSSVTPPRPIEVKKLIEKRV